MLTLRDVLNFNELHSWVKGTTIEGGSLNVHQSLGLTSMILTVHGLHDLPVYSVSQHLDSTGEAVTSLRVITAPISMSHSVPSLRGASLILTFYDETHAEALRREANLKINAAHSTTNEERLLRARLRRATTVDVCPFCQSSDIGLDDPDDPNSDPVVDYGCNSCRAFVRTDGFWQAPFNQGDKSITVWHPIKDQIQILVAPNGRPLI